VARVLLLTSPAECADLAFLLEEEGVDLGFLPVLAHTRDSQGLRAAAEQFTRFTWVVALDNAVLRSFLEGVHRSGFRGHLARVQWLCGDGAMARTIERAGGLPRVPANGKWAAAVSGLINDEDEVLILAAGEPPEQLIEALDAAGCHAVTVKVEVESPTFPETTGLEESVVVVHSVAAAEAWAALTLGVGDHAPSVSCCGPDHEHTPHPTPLAEARTARVVAASKATAEALQGLGVQVYATAEGTAADQVIEVALKALAPG
jgi:uroporphyrinogen-III synthase